MNVKGEFVQAWGDGEYNFKLSVAGILEIEEKCAAPFATIFSRVSLGAYSYSDIAETIRLGLIGGGTKAVDAKKLVDRYALPLADSAPIARLVLAGVMFGFEVAPPGKAEAAPTRETELPSDTTPPNLSEMLNSLELHLKTSNASRSGNISP